MDYIKTQFRATVSHDCGTCEVMDRATRAEAEAAAAVCLAEMQAWIDSEYRPELLSHQRGLAMDNGEDPDSVTVDVPAPTSRIECLQYQVGDDDITDDPIAQAIVEAIVDTPHVRWPTSRSGDRAGRPMRLLFADHPTLKNWAPIDLVDSEVMLTWFMAHGLEYPDVARQSRRVARHQEHMSVRELRQAEYRDGPGKVLGQALANVARLERELAAARDVAMVADIDASAAAIRRDQNIQWHAEALARRPNV